MKQQIYKCEDGFAHLLIIVVAVMVIAAAAFAGWRVMSMQKTNAENAGVAASNSATTAAAAGAESQCMAQLHDDLFCKFAAAEAAHPIDKSAYKVTLTSTNNGVASTIDFTQDGKGNNSMTMSGNGTDETFVEFGGVEYMKAAGEATWTSLGAGAPTTEPSSPSDNLSFLGSLLTVKITKLGTEACGSQTCYKYQFSDSAQPGATQYMWFDNQDYLLREYQASGGLLGTMDMKISYPAVTITKPSPVQSLTSSLGQ